MLRRPRALTPAAARSAGAADDDWEREARGPSEDIGVGGDVDRFEDGPAEEASFWTSLGPLAAAGRMLAEGMPADVAKMVIEFAAGGSERITRRLDGTRWRLAWIVWKAPHLEVWEFAFRRQPEVLQCFFRKRGCDTRWTVPVAVDLEPIYSRSTGRFHGFRGEFALTDGTRSSHEFLHVDEALHVRSVVEAATGLRQFVSHNATRVFGGQL